MQVSRNTEEMEFSKEEKSDCKAENTAEKKSA